MYIDGNINVKIEINDVKLIWVAKPVATYTVPLRCKLQLTGEHLCSYSLTSFSHYYKLSMYIFIKQ